MSISGLPSRKELEGRIGARRYRQLLKTAEERARGLSTREEVFSHFTEMGWLPNEIEILVQYCYRFARAEDAEIVH